MDETLAMMDDNRAKRVLKMLSEHTKTSGQCIIFCCHDREERLCQSENIEFSSIEMWVKTKNTSPFYMQIQHWAMGFRTLGYGGSVSNGIRTLGYGGSVSNGIQNPRLRICSVKFNILFAQTLPEFCFAKLGGVQARTWSDRCLGWVMGFRTLVCAIIRL